MAYERKDFDDLMEKHGIERVRRLAPSLRAQEHAALSASQITGDEHWDHFLEVVQARIKVCIAERDKAVEALKNSDDFSPEILVNQKLAARLFGKEVKALEWVIELPKIIMEQGEQARKLLENIDKPTH
jgi:hypothetical protein